MSIVVGPPREHVLRIRLHAPDVRHAISQAMAVEFEETINRCAVHPELKVLVITGTDPAFRAGVDLRDISAGRRVSRPFLDVLAESPKPVENFKALKERGI